MTATTLAPGALIHQRYQIVRAIGRGGMGAIYEATDTRLGSTVALKQTLLAGQQMDEAFAREARLLASLRHAALPVVSDYFAEGDGRFLVMQYIPGDDFGAILERRTAPFGVEEVLGWATTLLDALDYLHTQSPPVIHRDIKPQNLKLTPRGEIVLLDFGLAKQTVSQPGVASMFGYTPQYAPLEQIRGSGTDARSDLYSLGATLYHLLGNTLPPNALERAAATLAGQPDPLRPLGELNRAIPAGVAMVIDQMLALNQEQRPASAAVVRAHLVSALRAGSAGAPTADMNTVVVAPPVAPTLPRPPATATTVHTRQPWRACLLVAGLGIAVLIGMVLIVAGLLATRGSDEPLVSLPGRATPEPTSPVDDDRPRSTVVLEPTELVIPTIPAIPTLPALPNLPLPGQQDSGLATIAFEVGGAGTGPGLFDDPRGVAVDADGNIFVSDYVTGRVQRFDPSGRFSFSWVSEGETPILALATTRDGQVFVSRASGVQVYDGASGEQTGSFADGDGFQELIVLPDKTLLGVPWAGSDVVRLDERGEEISSVELLAGADTNASAARVAADGLGTTYVLDGSGETVFIFDSDGRFVDRFSVPGGWSFSDIAFDGRGRIYVSTFGEGVRMFESDGREVGTIPYPGTLFGLTFDDQGDLYAVGTESKLVKFALAER
jgi:DNA-binding beta-propeller fold protein YncE